MIFFDYVTRREETEKCVSYRSGEQETYQRQRGEKMTNGMLQNFLTQIDRRADNKKRKVEEYDR